MRKFERRKFEILKIEDSRKTGSEIEVGNVFEGDFDGSRAIYYMDKAGCPWIFYVGDTCKLIES